MASLSLRPQAVRAGRGARFRRCSRLLLLALMAMVAGCVPRTRAGGAAAAARGRAEPTAPDRPRCPPTRRATGSRCWCRFGPERGARPVDAQRRQPRLARHRRPAHPDHRLRHRARRGRRGQRGARGRQRPVPRAAARRGRARGRADRARRPACRCSPSPTTPASPATASIVLGFTPGQSIDRVVAFARSRGMRRFGALVPTGTYGERAGQALHRGGRGRAAAAWSAWRAIREPRPICAPPPARLNGHGRSTRC